MASFQEYKRRSFLPLVALGLAGYFLLVFLQLSRRADALDLPIQKSWQKLATSLGQSNAINLDFSYITNQLQETRSALTAISSTRQAAAQELNLPEEVRDRMQGPFQLFEYQNELSHQLDSLDVRAKKQKVAIDPAVFSGFPEHSFTVKDPSLLWAALAYTESMLDTALSANISSIHSLAVPISNTNSAASEAGRWIEIPVEMEVSASAENAARFLEMLPTRPAGPGATNTAATVSAAKKGPLLIESFIMRKQMPEKLDEVRLWIRAVGFLYRS